MAAPNNDPKVVLGAASATFPPAITAQDLRLGDILIDETNDVMVVPVGAEVGPKRFMRFASTFGSTAQVRFNGAGPFAPTPAQMADLILVTPTAAANLTLPAIGTGAGQIPPGVKFTIKNLAPQFPLTILGTGGDKVDGGASIVIGQGGTSSESSNFEVSTDPNNNFALTADAAGGQGGSAGVGNFAMFFGMTAGTDSGGSDYPHTIAVKTIAGTGRVGFPQAGPAFPALGNGITISVGASNPAVAGVDVCEINLRDIGFYEVSYFVPIQEPGALQLELQGAVVLGSIGTDQSLTAGPLVITGHQMSKTCYVQTTVANSKLALINPTGNPVALTVSPDTAANTHANAPSITVMRIA